MKAAFNATLIWIVCLFLFIPAHLKAEEAHQHEHERESCRVCGMYIDLYWKTAGVLKYKDGRGDFSCGVACLLRIVDEEGGVDAFESVQVHDWVTGELIDANKAYYVLGSEVIPDMIPNYIAFAEREEAEAFIKKEGGSMMDFGFAYTDVSPVGTTAPFRIRTAVTPGKGTFNIGIVYGHTWKDNVQMGTNDINPGDFIGANPAQPRAPRELIAHQQALILNYAVTDRFSLFMNIPWFERSVKTLNRTPNGITGMAAEGNSLGDITLESRYNFWRSDMYNHFASILLGTTFPTGRFDNTLSATPDPVTKTRLTATSPALQFGKDVPTVTGGLLYSYRLKKFWFHGSALYNVNPKNDSDFAFGDVLSGGVAFHYTPNYDLMLGVEVDANHTWKNEDQGHKIGNTGGTVTNLALVGDYRFLNAFGGNFKLRSSIGLPIYEDLNSRHVILSPTRQFDQVQLGGGFFANVAIQWTYRKSPY